MNAKNTRKIEYWLELFSIASDVFEETVFVVDFKHRCFLFVSNKGIFLDGHSSAEVLQLGYDFFQEIIYPKDYQLVENCLKVTVDYFSHPDTPINDLSYVVFDFRLRGYKGKLRMCLKVMPLVMNNQFQIVVCNVNRSMSKSSGNLIAYYNDKYDICFQYSFENERWNPKPLINLKQIECDILNFSKQGLSGKEMADIIGINEQSLRNIQNIMYHKINVCSTMQASIFAKNHKYVKTGRSYLRKKVEKLTKTKKNRKKMTQDKLMHIQDMLNNGESIRAIAKKEDISEFMIRYAKKNRKLI